MGRKRQKKLLSKGWALFPDVMNTTHACYIMKPMLLLKNIVKRIKANWPSYV
jgi:hypothetical protein